MTGREVEEIVAHARALIEAHDRRHAGYGFATESEAQAIRGVSAAILKASEAEEARLQAA